jgi:hypothetical protein
MLNQVKAKHTSLDIESQIENGTAAQVFNAAFTISENDGIEAKFFRLWGEVVKAVYDRSTTITTFYFVKGDDKELFNAHYS